MKSLVVAGGNLYQIARELGDATQWIRIAQLNDLSDPMLSGVVTLIIPAPDPNAEAGLFSSSLNTARSPAVRVLVSGGWWQEL